MGRPRDAPPGPFSRLFSRLPVPCVLPLLLLPLLFPLFRPPHLPRVAAARLPQPSPDSLPRAAPGASLADDLLALLDLDHNGVVAPLEFERLLEQYNVQSLDEFDIKLNEGAVLFRALDLDGDGAIDRAEIGDALRSQHLNHFTGMSSEDVQVWLESCTELREYRAHFLEGGAKGTDLMTAPTGVDSVRQLFRDKDQRLLRAAVIGALLRSYYVSSTLLNLTATTDSPGGRSIDAAANAAANAVRASPARRAYLPRPKLVEARATLLTVRISQPSTRSRLRVVKYKVQICRTSGKSAWRRASVPACGFGWNAVWPSRGISEVRFVGLSPLTSYQLRVKAFHCDGRSLVSDTLDVQTYARPTSVNILLDPRKWLRGCFLPPLTPSAPSLVSRTSKSVLLEWGRNCVVDSSLLRWSQECQAESGLGFRWGMMGVGGGAGGRRGAVGGSALGAGAGERVVAMQLGTGPGWDIPGLATVSTFLHGQMYCAKQRFVVQYAIFGHRGGDGGGDTSTIGSSASAPSSSSLSSPSSLSSSASLSSLFSPSSSSSSSSSSLANVLGGTLVLSDALCAQQDEDTDNDNPLDCLVKNLLPGKLYVFRLAAEADGMRSEWSAPRQVMTHCVAGADCAWGGENVTCNPHTKLCEGFNPAALSGLAQMMAAHTSPVKLPLSVVFVTLLCVYLSWQLLVGGALGGPGLLGIGGLRGIVGRGGGGGGRGRGIAVVHDYHDPEEEVPTKFAPDMVGLQRRTIRNLEAWPSEGEQALSRTGGGGFHKENFQKAFDIKLGETVYRVSEYLGGGSFGRVFLATEVLKVSAKRSKKATGRRGGGVSLRVLGGCCCRSCCCCCSSGCLDARGFRPKGESVAIKFLPQGQNMNEVYPGTLARRRRAKHVAHTLFYTTESNVWKHASAPPHPFVVMETAEFGEVRNYQGASLGDGCTPFPEPVIRRIFSQLLEAVEFLHAHRYVHLDIKLENVLINVYGDVKLIDFGCCRRIDEGAQGVSTGGERKDAEAADLAGREILTFEEAEMAGSKLIRAPELTPDRVADMNAQSMCDFRSDLWSCGVCLLSMLQGTYQLVEDPRRHLVDGAYWNLLSDWNRVLELLQARGEPVSFNGLNLLHELLQRDPDARPQTAHDVLKHKWLDAKPATDEEMARMMVSHNEDQVRRGVALIPEGCAEEVLPFYMALTQQLRLAQRRREQRPADSPSVSPSGTGCPLPQSPAADDVHGTDTTRTRSPGEAKSTGGAAAASPSRKKPRIGFVSSPSSSPARPRASTASVSPQAAACKASPDSSSGHPSTGDGSGGGDRGRDSIFAGSPLRSPSRRKRWRHSRASVSVVNMVEIRYGPLSGTPIGQFQRDVLRAPKVWHPVVEWLFQYKAMVHPAQVNMTVLRQAIRATHVFTEPTKSSAAMMLAPSGEGTGGLTEAPDNEAQQQQQPQLQRKKKKKKKGINPNKLERRISYFQKRFLEAVATLNFPTLCLRMRSISGGGLSPLHRNAAGHFGGGVSGLRSASGGADTLHARRDSRNRNRLKGSSSHGNSLPEDGRGNVVSLGAGADGKADGGVVVGARRRKPKHRRSITIDTLGLASPFSALTETPPASSPARGMSDYLPSFPGSVDRTGPTGSLWIRVQMAAPGVAWTFQQRDFLDHDFGVSDVFDCEGDPYVHSSFTIDGQRLRDLSSALGLGKDPISSLLANARATDGDAERKNGSPGSSSSLPQGQQLGEPGSPPPPTSLSRQPTLVIDPAATLSSPAADVEGSPLQPPLSPGNGSQRSLSSSSSMGAVALALEKQNPATNPSTPAPSQSSTEESYPGGRAMVTPVPLLPLDVAERDAPSSSVLRARRHGDNTREEDLLLELLTEQRSVRNKMVQQQVFERYADTLRAASAVSTAATSTDDTLRTASVNSEDSVIIRSDTLRTASGASGASGASSASGGSAEKVQALGTPGGGGGAVAGGAGGLRRGGDALGSFRQLPEDTQADLYAALALYRFAPGQPVCTRGQWAHGLHVVTDGAVLVKDGDDRACPPQMHGSVLRPYALLNAHAVDAACALSRATAVAAGEPGGSDGGCTTMFLDGRRARRILETSKMTQAAAAAAAPAAAATTTTV